jgi:protein-S-isoprenylcysteine O-methyltransferase Ste14
MNLLVLALFAMLAISSYEHFASTGTLRCFGVLVVNTLFVTLFLARRPAKSESDSPALWVLGIAGTAVPLLLRPTTYPSDLERMGDIVQLIGLLLLAASLLCLRRSFGVVAANRGVRSGGLYRIVRHPVYFSELLVLLGVVVANPSTTNLVLWICECALQFVRACAEERFLSSDPAYCAYRERVRYRLIPGVL